jgi:hypothetical protein
MQELSQLAHLHDVLQFSRRQAPRGRFRESAPEQAFSPMRRHRDI